MSLELVNVEHGVEYLKRVDAKGHSEATYAYGMILLSSGDQQGLKLLNSMNSLRSRHWNVRGYTDKANSILSQMLINDTLTLAKVNTKCQERKHAIRFERMGSRLDDREEISGCDICLWYREHVYFCKSMNVIV
ncbi:hypothetical protein Hdeb2414_s0002g00054971 [Helianthus debilis subsp. tardiflorus]